MSSSPFLRVSPQQAAVALQTSTTPYQAYRGLIANALGGGLTPAQVFQMFAGYFDLAQTEGADLADPRQLAGLVNLALAQATGGQASSVRGRTAGRGSRGGRGGRGSRGGRGGRARGSTQPPTYYRGEFCPAALQGETIDSSTGPIECDPTEMFRWQ